MKYYFPHEEQLARVLRLRSQLNCYAVADGQNFEAAIDAFTSFFIQCYHVRDWVISSGYSHEMVDRFIMQSTWLSLCKDLANKQKHQKITRYRPQNNFVDFGELGFGISTPITRYYDPVKQEARFGIDVWEFKMPIDVIEAADKCVREWDGFLKAHPLTSHSLP